MSDSNLFKPSTSQSGIGKKAMDKGQFSNPPAYTDVAALSPSTIKPDSRNLMSDLQKTPSARKGKI